MKIRVPWLQNFIVYIFIPCPMPTDGDLLSWSPCAQPEKPGSEVLWALALSRAPIWCQTTALQRAEELGWPSSLEWLAPRAWTHFFQKRDYWNPKSLHSAPGSQKERFSPPAIPHNQTQNVLFSILSPSSHLPLRVCCWINWSCKFDGGAA